MIPKPSTRGKVFHRDIEGNPVIAGLISKKERKCIHGFDWNDDTVSCLECLKEVVEE